MGSNMVRNDVAQCGFQRPTWPALTLLLLAGAMVNTDRLPCKR
jgi:hypothetical protein